VNRVEVRADQKSVDTGIDLVAGRAYLLEATGSWCDKAKSCGPDGYASLEYPRTAVGLMLLVGTIFRRVRRARWLALIGQLADGQSQTFVIGPSCRFEPSVSGRLTCFANDAPFAYGNNSGRIVLCVSEISPTEE